MEEPNIQKQIDDSQEQYADGLITEEEYREQLARISHNYDEWLKRNE